MNKNFLYNENRPWGSFQHLFEEEGSKIKRIYVKPNQRLSYQRHKHRDEIWTVIDGDGSMILDDKEISLTQFFTIKIPKLAKHRLIAGDNGIELIEHQSGSYLGEDDIERFDDDYGRI